MLRVAMGDFAVAHTSRDSSTLRYPPKVGNELN
jgi:hypothetical protein